MALAGKSGSFWSSISEFDSANLLTNPSFETGSLTPWTGGTVISTDAWDGTYSVSVTAQTLTQTTGAASVAANDYIAVRCAVKASGTPSAAATLKLEFFDATPTSLGSTSVSIPTTTASWKRFSLIYQAPTSTDHIAVTVEVGTGDTYLVDDFQVVKLEQIGGFSSWSIDATVDTQDVTDFVSAPWRSYVVTLKGWTGSADRYWVSEEFFNHLTSTDPIYCVFYIDESNKKRFEGKAIVTGISPNAAVDAVVTANVTFQGKSDLSYHTS